MAQYFTILTNLLVAVILGGLALNRIPSAGVVAGTLLSIVMVGVVYHVLLAPEVPLQGARFWTDLGFHTLTPVATLLWWIGFANKALRLSQVPYWLIWPTGYCAYALARGLITGRFAYFFFDIERSGIVFVGGYIAALVAVFAVTGALIVGVAKMLDTGASAVRI